ncbi:phage major capsid protein [Flexibacterium corallicola]|uniref:phage major capsid protein n=1 Tax=Flexibacterium corallicola TaxID=3037259 RepID=UPI00286F4E83|nr:phage major capsid protein [Pseudovibrio sp. M1P-2-3]
MTTPEAVAAVSELQKTFSEFKAASDEQIKSKADDVIVTEKLDRINNAVSDMQAAIDQANIQIAANQLNGGANGPVDAEYTGAFEAHVRAGEIQASLSKGTDEKGGYVTPIEWDRTITDKLVEISPMRQVCGVISTSKDGYSKLLNLHGASSGWVGETDARPNTNSPQFAQMEFSTGEIYANPSATRQLLDDAEINIESWLASEVQQEFSVQENLAFIAGDGNKKPKGLLTYVDGEANASANPLGPIEQVVAASATGVTPDELLDLIYDLPSTFQGSARFLMNRNSQKAIRKLKDNDGNYLWQPSLVAGQPSSLLGYPLTDVGGFPDMTTGAIPIAFGDFKRGYKIIDRIGVRIIRDELTNKPNVQFYTTKRVGGGAENTECMKVIRMA